MLCDEVGQVCALKSLCMTTFECETESPLYDAKTTWMKDIRPQSLVEEREAAPTTKPATPPATVVSEEAAKPGSSGPKVKVVAERASSHEAGDPLYTAGDVLGLPNPLRKPLSTAIDSSETANGACGRQRARLRR